MEVLFGMAFMLLVGILLFWVHQRWQSKEQECEKAGGVLNEASHYSKHLAQHFMPSCKVAKYQFRGIRAPKATVNIAFHKLGLTLPTGIKVLNGVTGEFKAGRMCAIMGPSGAGKTTFMNVLCGKATYGKMSGRVLINGRGTPIRAINSVVGFVPQDDIVHENLTVREQIRVAAFLRNKVGTSKRRIECITDDVVNVMQIDHIQNSIVGSVEKRGISGGQRKRVNIGLELAGQPTVLFLDEPTSGLDSTSSLAVVYSLKKMCQLGMNCIMVIHQPRYSLFTLFDDVLLLGKGGHTVYLGPSGGAKSYFENLGFRLPAGDNRADWFMDIISGEVPSERIKDFAPSKLFDLWTQRNALLDSDVEAPGPAELGRQDLSADEDASILVKTLEEEWDMIDINRDGFLDADELKSLLSKACRLEPSNEVVQELLQRMAPESDVVTKSEFRRYIQGLTSDIAMDNADERQEKEVGDLTVQLDTKLARVAEATTATVQAGTVKAIQQVTLLRTGGTVSTAGSVESEDEDSLSDTDEEDGGVLAKSSDTPAGLRRTTPQFFGQIRVLWGRAIVVWWRENAERAVFFAAMAIAAVVLALQDIAAGTPTWDAMSFVNTHTIVGLLMAIFCLTCFGRDQPVFWRERNRGISIFAFYLGRANLNLVDLSMQCFLFVAIYYELRQVHLMFFTYIVPYAMVIWATSGWGYAVSAWVPMAHGPFIVSLIVFVVCGLLGNPMTLGTFFEIPLLEVGVSLISVTRWSIPMSFLAELEVLDPSYPEGSSQATQLAYFKSALEHGYLTETLGFWWAGVLALAVYGFVLRYIAFLGLVFRYRNQQV